MADLYLEGGDMGEGMGGMMTGEVTAEYGWDGGDRNAAGRSQPDGSGEVSGRRCRSAAAGESTDVSADVVKA